MLTVCKEEAGKRGGLKEAIKRVSWYTYSVCLQSCAEAETTQLWRYTAQLYICKATPTYQ